MESLFSALRNYRPRPDRDSLEDFITEAWCWLLRRFSSLSTKYLSEVLARVPDRPLDNEEGAAWSWSTQYSLPGCRLDMVAEVGQTALIFEHKAWSGLGTAQLAKYREAGKSQWPSGVVLVLVTAAPRQWQEDADVKLTWADVYRVCGAWLQTCSDSDSYLVEDFRTLLDQESLGPPPPLDQEAIRSYLPAQRFEPALKRIVSSLLSKEAWGPVYEHFNIPGHEPNPTVDWTRQGRPKWGRCGIDLFSPWIPGIFVGVVLDGTDHAIRTPLDPPLGPDFHLILGWDHLKAKPDLETFVHADEFTALRSRLRADQTAWQLIDHYFEPDRQPRNRWHPLHLRRPLAKVMAGCRSLHETRDRFLDAGLEAAAHLLAGGELTNLLTRLRPTRQE